MPLDSSHPTVPSAAQAIALVDTWDDLPSKRRITLKSAVRMLQTITGLQLEQINMDPRRLNRALKTATHATAGLKKKSSFAVYKNSLRYISRRLGLLPSRHPDLTPPWRALKVARGEHDYTRIRLPGFMAWASAQGLTPTQVDNTTVAAYADYVRDSELRRDPGTHVRRVAKAWNDAVDTVPGWPQRKLSAPVKTERLVLKIDRFPESFQAENRAFLDRLSGKDRKGLFAGKGPRQDLSERTIEIRANNIRQAATALVRQGRDPATITGLADLVEEEAFGSILDFYFLRAGERVTTQLGGIASGLMMVARYYCCLPPEQIAVLAAIAREARPPKQTEMNDKNAERLKRLEDPYKEAQLLCLPTEMMREAWALRTKRPQEAAWNAAAAVAVQILLICPMRSKNLVELRLDTGLQRLGTKGRRITHMLVPAAQVKNKKRLDWPVPPPIADFIQAYLDEFRPLLPHHDNAWLFPHRDQPDRHRDQIGMCNAIVHAIRKHVGIEMHVHLFRGYAAKTLMEENPAAIDDLRLLLGHNGLEMAIRHYMHFRGKQVARRFNAIVFEKQRKAALLVAAKRQKARRTA
jgi:integrase